MSDFIPNLAFYEAKSNPILQQQSDAVRFYRNHRNYQNYQKSKPVLSKEKWNSNLRTWQQKSLEENVLYLPRYYRVSQTLCITSG